jgi:ABC-type nitrate/sulfonate/bicarbonate transport system substrate-binding protein
VASSGDVVERSTNGSMQVMVRPDGSIRGPQDLKGKVIATPTLGGVMHVATLYWLKASSVDPASIRGVEVPFPNMGDQLKAGRIDAIELLQPFVGQLTKAGFVSIGNPMLKIDDPVLFTFWISQGAWARSHRPQVAGFVAALTEAKRFIAEHPAEARVIVAKYTHLPKAVAENIPLPDYDFEITPHELEVWVKTLREVGQLNVPVDLAKMVIGP